MNLERVSNEEKLNLCRKYYLGGFAFLPFLWLVNIFWFFREAFLVPAYTEQSQIKGYVWRSAVGFLFWVIILTTWITIFQIYRPRWAPLGTTSPSPYPWVPPDSFSTDLGPDHSPGRAPLP